jgi:hypothetical protein
MWLRIASQAMTNSLSRHQLHPKCVFAKVMEEMIRMRCIASPAPFTAPETGCWNPAENKWGARLTTMRTRETTEEGAL